MAAATGVYTKMYLVSPAMYNQVRDNLKDVLQRRALEETNPGTFTQAELSGIEETYDDDEEDSQGEEDTTLQTTNSPTRSTTSETSVYFDTQSQPASDLDDSTTEFGPETDPSLRISGQIKRKRDQVQSPQSRAAQGAIPKKTMKFVPQQHSTPLELSIPGQHRCDMCGAVFTSFPALTNHKITQHNFDQSISQTTSASIPSRSRNLFFKCFICQIPFESAKAVQQHILKYHPTSKSAKTMAMATQQSVSTTSQPQSTIAFTPTHIQQPITPAPAASLNQSPSTSARDLYPTINIRSPRVSTISSSSSPASARDRSPITRNVSPAQASTPSRSVQSTPIRAAPSPQQLAAARRLDFDATAQPSTSQQAIAAANLQPVQPEVAEINVPRLPLQTCQETKKTRSPIQTRTRTGAKKKVIIESFRIQCEICGQTFAKKGGLTKHMNTKHKTVNRQLDSDTEMSGAGIKKKWKKF